MRRALLIAPFLLVLAATACGDDGGDSLGDDPSREDCIEALDRVLRSIEVPDGVDPSDGFDEEEGEIAGDAVDDAFAAEGIDNSDDDHPCNTLTEDMTDEEFAELTADVDPDVLAMLGAAAEVEFEETGDTIAN